MKSVSVVIPTLGGSVLSETLYSLNSGTIKPREIIICIPKGYILKADCSIYSNVQVVTTESKGQVFQRSVGFRLASSDYVLQLDDDVILNENTLEILVNSLNSNQNHFSCSPQFFLKGTRVSFYTPPKNRFMLKFYYLLINGNNGYKPGTITKAGTPIGCIFSTNTCNIQISEWLPGGCVLHHRKNLIFDNFYPLTGKAFVEDLFHSIILSKNNVSFYFVKDAIAYIDAVSGQGYFNNIKNIYSDFKARSLLLQLIPERTSKFRMYLFYLINLPRLIFI